MSGTNGAPGRYQVQATGPAIQDAEEAALAAIGSGVGDAFQDSLARIWARLQRDPREFGEPMYHLDAMRMEVRKGAIAPVYIEYGVHDEQPLVLIRRVRWLGPTA